MIDDPLHPQPLPQEEPQPQTPGFDQEPPQHPQVDPPPMPNPPDTGETPENI